MLSSLARLLGLSSASAASQPDRGSVGVYRRGERLLVAGDDQATVGYWVATSRIVVLPAEASPATLGAAVQKALAESRLGVPVPSREKGAPALDEPLWRAAGVRSRRAFMTGTRFCSVARERTELTISPTANGGTQGEGRGWRPTEHAPTVIAADATAETIGAAVLAALEQSTDGA